MIDLNFSVDLDAFAEVAGTIAGLQDAFANPVYLDSLAHKAHNEASYAFDLAAAASAGAGYLTHVYEFGVGGITAGRPKIFDPTSPAARLWVHNITGTRGMYNINYAFRTAIQPNPIPTTAGTGVPSKYLRMISRRKYVFRHKAAVMETGQPVEIMPKNGRFLFIPFYGEPGRNGKGYMMWNAERLGPIHTIPGKGTAGTFETFWEGWWRGEGQQIMDSVVDVAVNADTKVALEAAEGRGAAISPEPVRMAAGKLPAVAKAAEAMTSNVMKSKAAGRRGQNRR